MIDQTHAEWLLIAADSLQTYTSRERLLVIAADLEAKDRTIAALPMSDELWAEIYVDVVRVYPRQAVLEACYRHVCHQSELLKRIGSHTGDNPLPTTTIDFAPAAPTAVDLTLARPGDVCRLRDGTESVFYGRTPLTRGAQYASEFPFETNWDEQYRRDGSFSSVRGRVSTYDIIAVFGQRDGRLICGVDTERTVIGEQ